MAEPIIEPQQPQQQRMRVAEVECPECKSIVTVPVPPLRILNMPGVTICVARHADPVPCRCGVFMIPALTELKDVMWEFKGMKAEPANRVALAPAGLKLPKM